MNRLNFYDIPADYVNYLRTFEENVQGFSHVPYVNYQEDNRRSKFFCGIVLQINDMQYYVPVSSNTKEHEHTYYLYAKERYIPPVLLSSLRFDYMFPVPQALIAVHQINQESNPKYRRLLQKELQCCRQNESVIREYALRTYVEVLAPQKENGIDERDHSCNFRLLEEACRQYCREHGIVLEPQQAEKTQPAPGISIAKPRALKDICADAKAKAAELNANNADSARLPPVPEK